MLNVGALREGYVLDHIKAGKAMTIYHDLKLDKLDCTVAIIKTHAATKWVRKISSRLNARLRISILTFSALSIITLL